MRVTERSVVSQGRALPGIRRRRAGSHTLEDMVAASQPDPAAPGDNTPAVRRDSHTVESLLAVAVEVFNVRGYDGTSMEDLAKAAGITKSSIYHHVAGKEELLRLSVTRALDGLFAVLDEPGAHEGAAAVRLEHVVRRTCSELVRNLPHVTLLLRVRGNTPTERDALGRRREFDHRVAGLVAEAIEEGDLRAGLDPRLTARLIFGMVNSISEWYRPQPDGNAADPGGSARSESSPGALADAVADLVFDGLRAPRDVS
jgi:AcrR family transcriptional regulator